MIHIKEAKESLRNYMEVVLPPTQKERKYQTKTIKYQYAKVKEQIFDLAQLLDKPSLPAITASTPINLDFDLELGKISETFGQEF